MMDDGHSIIRYKMIDQNLREVSLQTSRLKRSYISLDLGGKKMFKILHVNILLSGHYFLLFEIILQDRFVSVNLTNVLNDFFTKTTIMIFILNKISRNHSGNVVKTFHFCQLLWSYAVKSRAHHKNSPKQLDLIK